MKKEKKKQAKYPFHVMKEEERKKKKEDEKQELEFAEGFRRIKNIMSLRILNYFLEVMWCEKMGVFEKATGGKS